MRYLQIPVAAALVVLGNVAAAAQEHEHEHGHDHMRPDAHAPIAVMGAHMHEEGGWMLSYRFMNMHMDGMRSGTDSVSTNDVALTDNPLAGDKMRMGNRPDGSPRIMTVPGSYRIAPLDMDMRMHMFSLMYGLSDKVTLMAMVNYVDKEMKLRTFAGPKGDRAIGDFKTETSGLGDTKIAALVRVFDDETNHAHLNLGVSLPTGSITEDGEVLPPFAGIVVPAGTKVDIDRLAYPMQLGSGTFDLMPGITYTGKTDSMSWGGQLNATLRLYDNDENYRLGNVFEATAWVAKAWQPWVSTSLRVTGRSEGSIKGRDESITGGNPLAATENSGRDEVDLSVGVNLLGQEGMLKGHRLAAEFGMPVYQHVDGLQMSRDWTLTLGWQKAF